MRVKLISILLISLIMHSCGRNALANKKDLQKSWSSSQLKEAAIRFEEEKKNQTLTREMNGFKFSACLIPSKIIAAISKDSNQSKDYDQIQVIELTISTPDSKDIIDYPSRLFNTREEKVNYFNSLIYNQLKLVTNNQEMAPLQVYYESTMGMKPFTKLLVYFKKPESQNQWTFKYEEEFVGLGTIQFQFDSDQITYVP